MKKIIILLCLIACLFNSCQNKNKHAYKFIHEATSMNKSCPLKIAQNIILDSVQYNEETNKMFYFFSTTGKLDDKKFIDDNYDKCKNELENAILNSPDMIEYQKHNVTLNYIYKSGSTGKKLAVFTFQLKYHSNRNH